MNKKFADNYFGRGIVWSFVGALLATSGIFFGILIGVIFMEITNISSEFVTANFLDTSMTVGIYQFVGLMVGSVVLLLINSVLTSLPVVKACAGFSNGITEGVKSTGKNMVFMGIPLVVVVIASTPLVVVVIASTIFITQQIYLDGGISFEMRNTIFITVMTIFPMLTFYQIGVRDLIM